MDVLYRVKPGQRNEQLRWSLRSLVNVPHDEVWIVGTMPPWVRNVNWIKGRSFGNKWSAIQGDLLKACEHLSGKTLLLIDDDEFILEPVPIPVADKGPLLDHAKRALGAYARTLRTTYDYLQEQGIWKPLSFEPHIPIVIEADGMAEVLRPVVKYRPMQARSLYGNLMHLVSERVHDVKARHGRPLPDGPFLSGNGNIDEVLPRLRACLPQKGHYEA